jgi:hypothetical protein
VESRRRSPSRKPRPRHRCRRSGHHLALCTTGTIEQRIDQVLQEKRELFDTIFSDVDARPKLGRTHDEIFGLFKLQCPTGPIRYAA